MESEVLRQDSGMTIYKIKSLISQAEREKNVIRQISKLNEVKDAVENLQKVLAKKI